MLDILFGQFAAEARASWPTVPFRGGRCGLPDRLFSELAEVLTPDKLVHAADGRIQAWAREGSVQCSASEALAHYAQSRSLYVPHVEHVHPALNDYLRALETELGVPKGSGHCSVFAGSAGSRVAPHCDHDFGFNLLVRGRKHWRVSEEGALAFPLRGHQLGRPIHADQVPGSNVPPSMPKLTGEFEQNSGECVFVPAGVWHETHLMTDCISLDFAIDPPRLADAVAESLAIEVRNKLLNCEQWRRPLDAAGKMWLEVRAADAFDNVFDGFQGSLRTELVKCPSFTIAATSMARGERTRWYITVYVEERVMASLVVTCATEIMVTSLLRARRPELTSIEKLTQVVAVIVER